MADPGPDFPYWSGEVVELSATLRSGQRGLSSEIAAEQLRLVGPNSMGGARRLTALCLLLRQFESPLVFILTLRRGS
jgi:P-type Mg2+ transporter